MDNLSPDLFETTDLNLASLLMERGLVMANSYEVNGTVYFSFLDRAAALVFEHEYRYENPTVILRYFMAHLNHLRDLLRHYREGSSLPSIR
jgi:hypothetical protein